VSHAKLATFFEKYVAGLDEIPWDDFLKTAGLHVVVRRNTIADTGFVSVHNFDAAPSIIRVRSGSEAERAGLITGDDVLTFNGHAVASDFERRIGELRPGD